MALDPGQMLQNRYRIVALLGEGGMGAVYRAWDTRLNVAVALKEMRPQPGLDPATLAGLREQFRREATILARLSHPNLVRVTDFFEEGSNAYLVMDFVLGESLAQKVAREGAQPEAQVIEWGKQLLDALVYCHEEGIIHRDIKPQNVIIHTSGKAVLVDFGLVKLWNPNDPRTQTIMRGMGTPEYAPPEQYDTHTSHTDPRSDLYSLGATLYHALTGQAPPTATQRMAMPGAFRPPRAFNAGISPQLEALITRAMELQLDRRFPSAAAMLDALRSQRTAMMPQGAVIQRPGMPSPNVPPPGSLPPMPPSPAYGAPAKPKKRVPVWTWVLGGLGALLLLASLVCILLLLLGGRDRSASPSTGTDNGTPTATVTPLPALQSPTPRATPTPEVTIAQPTAVPQGGGFQLRVENRSTYDICYVQISLTDSTTWGDDWLAGDELIYANSTRVFDVPAGTYDVKVSDCEKVVLATAWDVSSDYTLTIGGSGFVALRVKNESSVEICFIFIALSTADSWGEDWLGAGETIASGGGQRVFFFPPGTYDLLAQDCEGQDLVSEFEVNFQSDLVWTISD